MTTTTNQYASPRHSVRRLLDHLNAGELFVSGYLQMLEIAERHGMQYEIERLNEQIAEYEADNEDIREALLLKGCTPE